METGTPKVLLRIGDVATALSISRSMAYKLVASGEIPSVKLGGSIRVPVSALVELASRFDGTATAAGR
jgi:excisionase family DNA binding protein